MFFLTASAVFYAAFISEWQLWGGTGYCRLCVFCEAAPTQALGQSGPPYGCSTSRCSGCKHRIQCTCSRSMSHIHGAQGRYRLDILNVLHPKRKTGEIHSLIFVFVFKLFSEQLKKKNHTVTMILAQVNISTLTTHHRNIITKFKALIT